MPKNKKPQSRAMPDSKSDKVNPPTDPATSSLHSTNVIIDLLEEDPTLAKYWGSRAGLLKRPESSGASSSSDEVRPNFILTSSQSKNIILSQWLRLFQELNQNEHNSSLLDTPEIREWVANHTHLKEYISSLIQYTRSNFPNFERDKILLINPVALPIERTKVIIEEQRKFVQIAIFVLRQIQNSDNQDLKKHWIYPLTFKAFEFKSSLMGLTNLFESLPVGQSTWFFDNVSFFGQAFETIYPTLNKIGMNLILNLPMPGIDKSALKMYQLTMVSFFTIVLDFYRTQITNRTYEGEISKALDLCQHALLLIHHIKLNTKAIVELSECHETMLQNSLKDYQIKILQYQTMLLSPIEERFDLTLRLKKIECAFDASLVAVHTRDSLNPIVLSDRFNKINDQIEANSDFKASLAFVRETLPELLLKCFGSNRDYNIFNANQLKGFLAFYMKFLDNSNQVDHCLLNMLKQFWSKNHQVLIDWQAELFARCKPVIKNLMQTLQSDWQEKRLFINSQAKQKFEERFQQHGFIIALEHYLINSTAPLSIPESCLMLQLACNFQFPVNIHEQLIKHIATAAGQGFSSMAADEIVYNYRMIEDCIPVLLIHSGRLATRMNLETLFLADIYLKHSEAYHYYINGLPEIALDKLAETTRAVVQNVPHIQESDRNLIQQSLLSLKKKIEDPTTDPNLLAYMLKPTPTPIDTETLVPGDVTDSPDSYRQQMQRFHSAHQLLYGRNDAQENKMLYLVWRDHFRRTANPVITRNLLLSHWERHYYKSRQRHQLTEPVRSSSKLGQSTVTAPVKKSREKIDWTGIYAQRLEQFNNERPEILNQRREKRRVQKQAAVIRAIPASRPRITNEVEVEIKPFPCDYDAVLLAPVPQPLVKRFPLSDSVQKLMKLIEQDRYEVLIVGGDVRDKLLRRRSNDVDIFTNCPASVLFKLIPNLMINEKFASVFYLYIEEEKLHIDIKCTSFSSHEDLAATLDFNINAFMLDSEGVLHVPLAQSFWGLDNRHLKTIAPIAEAFAQDISRLWRMIRINNQLKWQLGQDEIDAIKQFGPQLCQLPFDQFFTQFKRCFIKNREEGLGNFNSFIELGLFHFLLMKDPHKPLANKDYCLNKFNALFDKDKNYRFVDTLALFILLTKEPSLAHYQNELNHWIAHFEKGEHNPGIMASLKREVPPRLAHYHRQLIYNIDASPYNPYETPASQFLLPFIRSEVRQDATEQPEILVSPGNT